LFADNLKREKEMILSPKNILSIDAVFSAILGTALFFLPEKVGNFVLNRETDGVHWHLIRCVGGQIIATAFFFWRFKNRTPETLNTCFILRVTSLLFGLLLAFNIRSTNPELINPIYLNGAIYASFGVIAIYVILIIAYRWPIGGTLYEHHVGGNGLFQLDSLASIVIGMAWLACPQWLLHRQVKIQLDPTHDLCGRVMGALFVAGHIISSHSLHWKFQKDRSVAAETRTLVCLLILSAQLWSQAAYERDWGSSHWVGISLFSIWTVIAFIFRCYIYFVIGDNGEKIRKSK
jgi:DNA segregation ATPase FtsK/SpoIIIE-like protein